MGKRFFTAENAELAEIKKGKHETRSSKSETNFNLPKEEISKQRGWKKILDGIVSRKGAKSQSEDERKI
jgi:hypothetical protein